MLAPWLEESLETYLGNFFDDEKLSGDYTIEWIY